MSIVLRLDIDKPYGRKTWREKVFSKLRENFYFPALTGLGYLSDLRAFLTELNLLKIPAVSYHRICTYPSKEIQALLKAGGHKFGLHAEDTRSLVTLTRERAWLTELAGGQTPHSFTKHGSGELKLGRRHYAPYEPEKYLEWSAQLGLPFLYGNGIAHSAQDFEPRGSFFPNMFWLEPGYQDPKFESVDQALAAAKKGTLILIVHPENLRAIAQVRERFYELVEKAKAQGIDFVIP